MHVPLLGLNIKEHVGLTLVVGLKCATVHIVSQQTTSLVGYIDFVMTVPFLRLRFRDLDMFRLKESIVSMFSKLI